MACRDEANEHYRQGVKHIEDDFDPPALFHNNFSKNGLIKFLEIIITVIICNIVPKY